MPKQTLDSSLYLVTGRELLPSGKDYYESLEESLKGGVTLVQVREKEVDTGEFIEVARNTKEICDKYNVPLLINDRIDVHLAIGSAGIHIGQSDTPLALARKLVGADAIIGHSVSSAEEAQYAVDNGADYVGIGPVWSTNSKDVTHKKILGCDGVGAILEVLAGTGVEAVAIGGVHTPNLPQLLHGSIAPGSRNRLAGVAVISDIVSSIDPQGSARMLREVIDSFKRSRSGKGDTTAIFSPSWQSSTKIHDLIGGVMALMGVVKKETPLIHQITNNVVINDSANATLAVGASPIMATNPSDCKDLSPVIGALLVNFGTITDKNGMLVAGREANVNKKPLVFDPVAIGATSFRRQVSKELLSHWQPTVIKGNAAEIGAMAESTEVLSRGVDSVGSGFADPGRIVKALARKRAAIVVLTGENDYISDGNIVLKASNGHELLGSITGSGCMTGTLVATFCAAARLHYLSTNKPYEDLSELVQGDMLLGALAGVCVFNVAAEIAAERDDVKGPGTFRAALLDELYNLTPEILQKRVKVELVECYNLGPFVTIINMLTPEQLQTWRDDGYLVIPGFCTQEETGQMIGRAKELLNEFDPSDHPLTTFKTGNDHVGDDYFINSNDKIRYFLEPSSLSTPPEGSSDPPKLLVPPSQSINKIGHALAVLDPVFRKYTLEDGRIRDVAKDLGHFKSAKVLQSMIICKQPRIGGVVPCHNDSTFLYTDPPSAVGAWIALEDCTPANGCLSFLPGSHKLARISSRFVKDPKGHGTTFEPVPGIEENEEKWDEMPGWKEAACPAGTLVLIHGSVMHKSPPNPSEKTRMIYTFHMIEGEGAVYDEKNWLQPTSKMPFPALF